MYLYCVSLVGIICLSFYHVNINHCGEPGPCITKFLILTVFFNVSVKIYSKCGSLTPYSGYRKIRKKEKGMKRGQTNEGEKILKID